MKKVLTLFMALILSFSFVVSANADNENKYIDKFMSSLKSQIGYQESDGKTKYGEFMGSATAPWSAPFIAWCADDASLPKEVIPLYLTAHEYYEHYSSLSMVTLSSYWGDSYTPETGDLVFFTSDAGHFDSIDGIGFVENASGNIMTVIYGDYNNTVVMRDIKTNDESVIAFVTPDYNFTYSFAKGKYITEASALNFRAQPTTSSSVYTTIPMGTVVEITEFSGNWGKTTYNGMTGWISMDYAAVFTDSHSGSTEKYNVKWNVIDVSYWQGSINWSKIAATDIEAVIMRIGIRNKTTGKIEYDDNFITNYQGAKSAGLHVGCYFYSRAATVSEAQQEAQFIIDATEKYKLSFDMPIYYDAESDALRSTGKTNINAITNAFLTTLEYEDFCAGIYCSSSWAKDYYTSATLSNRPLWLADWHSQCSYSGDYGMWQYTDEGSVAGVESQYTDLDICYINYPQYILDNGLNGFTGTIHTEDPSLGDINADGDVTAADARLALRFSAKIATLTAAEQKLADVNSSGNITAADARIILRVAAKLQKI